MNENILNTYYQLIGDNKMLPLSSFKSRKISKSDIFPDAKELPSFFSYNLLNQGRVVKVLRGPQAVFRGFYYQLMKLGFQIQNPKDDFASVIKSVIFDNPQIDSMKNSSPISGKQYSYRQYLKIIAQFMDLLQGQVIPNFQMNVKQYLIFDQAMLNCLQYLLYKNLQQRLTKIQSVFQILQSLCQIFYINLQTYESCVKFVESDVFLYLEDINQIYLAFLNQMAQIDQCQKTSQQNMSRDKQLKDFSSPNSGIQSLEEAFKNDIRLSDGNNNRKKKKNIVTRKSVGGNDQKQTSKSTAIINVFQKQECVKPKLQKYTTIYNQQQKDSASSSDKPLFQQFKLGIYESKDDQIYESKDDYTNINRKFEGLSNAQSKEDNINRKLQGMDLASNIQSISQIKNKQSQIENNIVTEVQQKFQKQKTNNVKSDIFYHPQKQQMKPYRNIIKKQQRVQEVEMNDGTLGTFYRQFSDSKIMQAMMQPYKSNVNKTRNKFKGVRSKKFYGFY